MSIGGAIVRAGEKIGLKQLFDDDSSIYTYLLWDTTTKDAIIVDSVDRLIDRDLQAVKDLDLTLCYGIYTHAPADRTPRNVLLKKRVPGLKSVVAKASGAKAAIVIESGDHIIFGNRFVEVRATPDQTNDWVSYVADDRSFVLNGSNLPLQGRSRIDSQGSAELLYNSVHSHVFNLPDDCIVYPAHNYNGRHSTTVGIERRANPRVSEPLTEFVSIMSDLKL